MGGRMSGQGTAGPNRAIVAVLATTLLLAVLMAPTAAVAHPGGDPADEPSADRLGVKVNAPDSLAQFLPAVQWTGSGEVDGQTADLVYAGTGCTPASYATVATQIEGSIALVDSRASATNPADQCPAYAFAQKAQAAQAAGAIGLVQIPGEGEAATEGNAITADIPALEVDRTEATLAVRDAVVAGTAVNVTLTEPAGLPALSDVPCEDGTAGPFPCSGIDLLSFVPQEEFDGAGVSDLWGWTDPQTGDEYVILGKTNGVAFFRVTDPTAPVYLGELPNDAVLQEVWHDVKVYDDHAFIVSESEPHGMKVFDLTRLRGVDTPQQWDRDALYPLNVAAHDIAINTDTGYAYILGGNAGIVAPDQCLSGLHMVDISTPKTPVFAGCYLEEGGPGTAARTVGEPATDLSPAAYVHDAQCVTYEGPDTRYTGREICFNFAEDVIVVADVTDKLAPRTLSVTSYPDVGYTHQGWLTEDQAHLIANDELDEQTFGIPTRSLVFDVTDLEDPKLAYEHLHDTAAIDHNSYVAGQFVYQSNYTAGLRVLDASEVADRLEEVAFFDTFPAHTDPTFDGTWSNYPFFESGTVAVSGIGEGLFLLDVHDDILDPEQPAVEVGCDDCPVEIRAGESGTAQVTVTNTGNVEDTYTVTVDGLPEGWSATAEPAEITLAPGASADTAVTVEVPRSEQRGAHELTVTATSSVDPTVTGSAELTVRVRKGRPSEPGSRSEDRPSQAGPPDQQPPSQAAPRADDETLAAASPQRPWLPVGIGAILGVLAALLAGSLLRRRLTR